MEGLVVAAILYKYILSDEHNKKNKQGTSQKLTT